MIDKRESRAWAEIDLDALAHNYHALRDWIQASSAPGAPVALLGMVKANAYGHGAPAIGRKLQELGADMLAVACLAEAAELREAGITIPILCLGQTPVEQAEDLLAYDVTQTVGDLEIGRALSAAAVAAGKELAIHIKLDTGMGRLGFIWREGSQAGTVEQVRALCALPGLRAEGLFTHFAAADEDVDYTELQGRRLREARAVLEEAGIHLKHYHCASSAAVLNYPWTHMDMVLPRPGQRDPGGAKPAACDGPEGPGHLGADHADRHQAGLRLHCHTEEGVSGRGALHRLRRRTAPIPVQ